MIGGLVFLERINSIYLFVALVLEVLLLLTVCVEIWPAR